MHSCRLMRKRPRSSRLSSSGGLLQFIWPQKAELMATLLGGASNTTQEPAPGGIAVGAVLVIVGFGGAAAMWLAERLD